MMAHRFSPLFVASCLAASVACGRPTPPPLPPTTGPVYEGQLRAPSAYPGTFLDEQTVKASFGDRSVGFSAVVQKRDDELLLLGRTPFGSRAFLLKQTGTELTFEKYVDRELPFSPRYMLLDVHRTLLRALPITPGETPPDGERSGAIDGELVTERWQNGKLVQKRFRVESGTPTGEIVIVYEGGMAPGQAPPRKISYDNGWFGYRLEITTERHQQL